VPFDRLTAHSCVAGWAYHRLVETTSAHGMVVAGQEAMHVGDFDAAARFLQAALAMEPSPEAHDTLAYLAYIDDDYEEARRHWELAHHGYLAAGDLRGAGLAAVHLAGTLYDGFLDEPGSRAWLQRAGELLNQVGRCVERGYLALALVACHARDAHVLEQSAVVALELAMEFGDPDLQARARADRGLALINQGRIAEGFDQLDQAMAAIVAGSVSPPISGTIFCAMLSACERTGDLKRAEEWTRTARRHLDQTFGEKVPILHSHCRTAYGVVLCDTGRLTEAEVEILQAFGPSATKAVSKQADAAGALARLRLMQGRLDEASDLLAPYVGHFEVCEQLAQLHLLRGEPDLAAAVLNRGLHDLVGDRLRAGRLLELLVEVELTRDHPDGAEQALERLEACALASESPVLRAAVSLSEGRISMFRSEWQSAVAALNEALDILGTEERPIMAGRIRLELATALAHTSDDEPAAEQVRSALAIFERLGARRDADKAAALLDRLAPRREFKPDVQPFDLIVIGSGPAGEKAAARAAYLGKRVALIERSQGSVGGVAVTHLGMVPTKTLRESALYLTGFRKREIYGASVQLEPSAIHTELSHRTDDVSATMSQAVRENIARHQIELIAGTATLRPDRHVVVETPRGFRRVLRGEAVLIATGSRPFHPPGIPFDDPDVFDSQRVLEIGSTPTSVVIVGGGAIGCEHASIFTALGTKVTLVDSAERLLGYVDAELSRDLRRIFESMGMDVRLGVRLDEVRRDSDGLIVALDDGSEVRPEKLLFASGRSGNTEGLGLEKAGVEVDSRGHIIVDHRYRTTAAGIYAAGDVIGPPALASAAMEQGRIAVCDAFGVPGSEAIDEIIPTGVYSIPEVAGVGFTEQEAARQGIDYEIGRGRFSSNARGNISGATEGLVKLVFRRDDRTVIGAHILGELASELIHIGQSAIHHRDTVEYFLDTTFNVPTYSEAYKYAAYDGLQRLAATSTLEAVPRS
jgi:NAD(P) transhydrogenase